MTNDGVTPLQIAIKGDNTEIAKILREAGLKNRVEISSGT